MSPDVLQALRQAKQEVTTERSRQAPSQPPPEFSLDDQYFIHQAAKRIAGEVQTAQRKTPGHILKGMRETVMGVPKPEDFEEKEVPPEFVPKPFAALSTQTALPPLVDTAKRDLQREPSLYAPTFSQAPEDQPVRASTLPYGLSAEDARSQLERQRQRQEEEEGEESQVRTYLPAIGQAREAGLPPAEGQRETLELPQTEATLTGAGLRPGGVSNEQLRELPPESLPLQFVRSAAAEMVIPIVPQLDVLKENLRPFGTPKGIVEKTVRGAGGLSGVVASFVPFAKGTGLVLKSIDRYNRFIQRVDAVSPKLSQFAHRGISNIITFNAHGQTMLPAGSAIEERLRELKHSSLMASAFTGAGSLQLLNQSAGKLEPYALFGIGAGMGDEHTPIEDRIINGALLVALHYTMQGATDRNRDAAVQEAFKRHGYTDEQAKTFSRHIADKGEQLAEVVNMDIGTIRQRLLQEEPYERGPERTILDDIKDQMDVRVTPGKEPVQTVKVQPSQEVRRQEIESLLELNYRPDDIIRMDQGDRTMLAAIGEPMPIRKDAHRGNIESMRDRLTRQIDGMQPHEEIVVNDYIVRKRPGDPITHFEIYNATGDHVKTIADSKFAPADILKELPPKDPKGPPGGDGPPPEGPPPELPRMGSFIRTEDIVGKVIGQENGGLLIRNMNGREVYVDGQKAQRFEPDPQIVETYTAQVERRGVDVQPSQAQAERQYGFTTPENLEFDGVQFVDPRLNIDFPDMLQFTPRHPGLKPGEHTTLMVKTDVKDLDAEIRRQADEKAVDYGYKDFDDMMRQAEARAQEEAPPAEGRAESRPEAAEQKAERPPEREEAVGRPQEDEVRLPVAKAAEIEERLDVFQPRREIDQKHVNHIINRWSDDEFIAPPVWRDTKGELGDPGTLYVLRGHHRLRAASALDKTVPYREFQGTLQEARNFAWRGDAQHKPHTPLDNARLVRMEKEENELTYDQILEVNPGLQSKEKIIQFYNLSFLNEKGLFAQNFDNRAFPKINEFVKVVGKLRRENPNLTDNHERQMFEFLYEYGGYEREVPAVREHFERQIDRFTVLGEIESNLRLHREVVAGDEARADMSEALFQRNQLEKDVKELRRRLESEEMDPDRREGLKRDISRKEKELMQLDEEIQEIKRSQIDMFGNQAGIVGLFDGNRSRPLKFQDAEAQKYQDMLDRQRRKIAEKEQRKHDPDRWLEILTREVVDRSGNIKRMLRPLKQGRLAIIRKDMASGSTAGSIDEFRRIHQDIFGELTPTEINTLGDYRQARVTVGLAKLEREQAAREQQSANQLSLFGVELEPVPELKIQRPGTPERAQRYMDKLQEENPVLYNVIEKASNKMDRVFAKKLREARDEGLIGEEAYQEMARRYWYHPTVFLDYYKNQYIENYMGGKEMKTKQLHLKRYDEGSTQEIVNNPELLLFEYIKDTNFVIARNKANRTLGQVADENPDNAVVRRADVVGESKSGAPIYETGRPDEVALWEYRDGQPRKMLMKESLEKEWEIYDPVFSQAQAKIIQTLSGNKILKAMATGNNPEFAISNFFRDIAHVWLVTKEYSPHWPIAMGQMLFQDIPKVALHAKNKTGPYIDYAREGGLMNFMTHQGRLGEQNPLARGMSQQLQRVQEVTGFMGEWAETTVRLALRERAMRNGHSSLEASHIARTYLDFAQGGRAIKMADHAIPYLNAGVQGTRGIVRAAMNDPGLFTYKVGQIGLLSSALYYANVKRNPEAWAQVSDREKATNWVITTPFWERDDLGRKRHYYFKIPKDQGQRVFAGLFEAGMARMETGRMPYKKLFDEAMDFFPIVPTEMWPPVMSAFGAYAFNRDFWTREDIWKGREVQPEAQFYKGYTPEAYVKLADIAADAGIHLSPVKMQRSMEKLFTYNNPFTGLTLGPYKALQTFMQDDHVEALNKQLISEMPFFRRVFERTFPIQDNEMETLSIEENTRRKYQNDEFYNLLEQFRDGKATFPDIKSYILSQPREDQRRLRNAFERWQKFQDVDMWWHQLADVEAPNVRAQIFYQRWRAAKKSERAKLMRMAGRIPGIASDEFKKQFKKLQQVNQRYLDSDLE